MSGAVQSVTTEEPEEQTRPTPSGRLLLRMPRTLHAELARSAEREGTSLNQFITSALASTVGWRDENGVAPGVRRAGAGTPQSYRPPRLVVMLLVANAVVIGLAAIAAIAVLFAAWQG